MKTGADTTKPDAEVELRGILREGFLKAVSELNGESCSIITYENTTLPGTFAGWKPDGSEILVRDLKTPAAVHMGAALVRTPDILAVKFDKPLELS